MRFVALNALLLAGCLPSARAHGALVLRCRHCWEGLTQLALP